MAKRKKKIHLPRLGYRLLIVVTSVIVLIAICVCITVSMMHRDLLGSWKNDSGYTVTFKSFGQTVYYGNAGKYEIERNKITISLDKDEEPFLVEYYVDGDDLTVVDGDGAHTFSRVD